MNKLGLLIGLVIISLSVGLVSAYDVVRSSDEFEIEAVKKLDSVESDTFYVKSGRNPQTGKEIQIAAKNVDKATPKLYEKIMVPENAGISCESIEESVVCEVSVRDEGSLYCWGRSCATKRSESDLDDTLYCWGRSCPAQASECPRCQELQEEINRLEDTREEKNDWTIEHEDASVKAQGIVSAQNELFFVVESFGDVIVDSIDAGDNLTGFLKIGVHSKEEGRDVGGERQLVFASLDVQYNKGGVAVFDEDVDGDAVPSVAVDGGGKSTPKLITNLSRGVSSSELEEEKLGVREYLRGVDKLEGNDFGLAVALHASENEKVREVRYDNVTNTVQIVHDEEMRLFGLFRMSALSRTVLHEDGREEVNRPWWSFLASKNDTFSFKSASSDLLQSAYLGEELASVSGGGGKVSVADMPIDEEPVYPDGFCDWCTWCC